MAYYKPVRALKRGLEVLCALNLQDGVRAQELSERTNIHRATIYRLLETLHEAGFVERSAAGDTYYVTEKVRLLSGGLGDGSFARGKVATILRELQHEVGWPTNFANFSAPTMVIQETTHHLSPYSMHKIAPGCRIPILHCALGQAYFSYCEEADRKKIVRILAEQDSPDRKLARDRKFLTQLVRITRNRGYGISPRIYKPDAETDPNRYSAIAVPVFVDERIIGSINIVYFASAVTQQDIDRQLLPRLKAAAGKIGRAAPAPYGPAPHAAHQPVLLQ